MVSFVIELADVCVGVNALFESTRTFCAEYLSDAAPAVELCLDEADIEAERARAVEQDAREGLQPRAWSDAYLETLALYRKVAESLLPYGVVVFHGAVVAVGERTYCFTAPSGTGKTTHVRFWLSQVSGAYVLNGDKPLLRVGDEGVVAYGTPWQGKERMGVRGALPLAGICELERGERDAIRPMGAREALPVLMRQTYVPAGPLAQLRVVELVGKIAGRVPLWRMSATLDEDSALVSASAMAGTFFQAAPSDASGGENV